MIRTTSVLILVPREGGAPSTPGCGDQLNLILTLRGEWPILFPPQGKAKRKDMTRSSHKSAAATAVLLLAFAGRPLAGASRPSFSLAPSGPALFGAVPGAGFSLAAPAPTEPASPSAVEPEAKTMRPHTRRALIQLGILATYSTVRYWADYHRWIEDWQYELTCADQYRRFLTTEAIRFDSNNFITNWTHVFAGVLYYQFARTNGWTWERSFLASTAASAFYEYVSEWREVISINDMFNTSFGAYELGEPIFQITDYFHHQKSPVLR